MRASASFFVMSFLFQGETRVKNVYASLANGTLVVFTPKTAFSARRFSHNDVTLVTKEEDELLTRESDKWSNLQVRCLLLIIDFSMFIYYFYCHSLLLVESV